MPKGNKPVKLTLTYQDGSTEDYECFIAILAEGLVAAGKHEGDVLWMATDKFTAKGIAVCAAPIEVMTGLLTTAQEVIVSIIAETPDELRLQLIHSLVTLEATEIRHEHSSKTVRIRPEEN